MAKGRYEQWLTSEGLGLVEAWAREGATDDQLAERIGIARKTLHRWEREHEPFGQALARGRSGTREQIENALYKKALGYNVKERVPVRLKKRIRDPDTGCWEEEEVIEMVDREKHVPPDMKAVQFWLTNREKLRWQKTPEQDDGEREGVTVIIDV